MDFDPANFGLVAENGERIVEDQKRYTGEKKMMRIVIPNQDRSDHTPWACFALPAKAVHENQYGNGLWAKVEFFKTAGRDSRSGGSGTEL